MDTSQPPPITSITGPSPFASAPPPPPASNPPSYAPGSMQPVQLSFDQVKSPDSHTPSPYFQNNNNNNNNNYNNSNNNSSDSMKKKRGRPRKYGPDGSCMALALRPHSADNLTMDPNKKRGRPRGSGRKKQLEALGSSGMAFTPHIITVAPGEDVASKIMAFSQQGPRTICVLSANGAISNVTLRQPATSGGLVTYEGRFEIISLSGSFLLAQDGDTRSRTGGLSVALSGSDGRVLGGCVAGMLMAATPVQVVLGSFIAEGKKLKPASQKREPMSAPMQMAVPAVPTHMAGPMHHMGVGPSSHMPPPSYAPLSNVSPPSEGTSSDDDDDINDNDNGNDESSDDDDDESGGPLNHMGVGPIFGPGPHGHGPAHYAPAGWPMNVNPSRHEPNMKMNV